MGYNKIENANKDIVALIALLHDVDDYKLFEMESAENLTNARNILEKCSIGNNIKAQVLNAVKTIGYSKRLKGISPITPEGMVVSDADMCDGCRTDFADIQNKKNVGVTDNGKIII